ncbi:MAG: LysM peptidoglycan-binding domain-containing protein [Treponema sp.]|nr:LysM peptidoglycan-binding domain-containing protein [Treponema sp.]
MASYKVPAVIPRNGAAYKIRWGDTLWDIAEAFYRNPWLYPRIARYNNIRNPDLIISGTTIRIPPKN